LKTGSALLRDLEIGLIEEEYRVEKSDPEEILATIEMVLHHVPIGFNPPRTMHFLARAARWCERTHHSNSQAMAESVYRKLIEVAETCGDAEMAIQAQEELGDLYRKQGQFESGTELQLHAMKQADAQGMTALKAHALNNLAVIAIENGRIDEAFRYFNEALPLLDTEPEPLLEGHIVNNIGVIHCIRGNPEKAIIEFNRALICRSAARDRHGFAETSHNLGMAHLEMNHLDSAEDYLDRALHTARGLGDGPTVANILLSRSELFVKRNKPVIAGAVASEARALFEIFDDPLGLADSLRFMGESEMALFRYDSAERCLHKAFSLNEQYHHLLGVAQCAEALCRLIRQRSGSDETIRKWAITASEAWLKLGNSAAAEALSEYL